MIFFHGAFSERTPFVLDWNQALNAVPVASSTAPGFSPWNALAENTWQAWRCGANTGWLQLDLGQPRNFDTLAVVGHNLASVGASLRFQHKLLEADAMTNLTLITPLDNRPAVLLLPAPVTARYVGLHFPAGASAPPAIAAVMIGPRLRLPAWVQPPYVRAADAETVEGEAAISRGGHYLGRTMRRRGGRLSPQLSPIDRPWFDANMHGFREHYNTRRPFLWASSPSDHVSDVVYGWRAEGAAELRADLLGGGLFVRVGMEMDFHVA